MAKLYLGNLPYTTTSEEIRTFFAPRKVSTVKIILDKETGRPRGFGFVELVDPKEMTEAIQTLDGAQLGGRVINVSEARERSDRRGDDNQREAREKEYAASWKP